MTAGATEANCGFYYRRDSLKKGPPTPNFQGCDAPENRFLLAVVRSFAGFRGLNLNRVHYQAPCRTGYR
jgi:hypothetical protein